MTIELVTALPGGAAPIFYVREGETIEAHPFFRSLDKADCQFLLAFQKKSPIKNGHSHLVFLPSTREVMLLGIPGKKKYTHRKALMAARRAVWAARKEKVKRIAVNLADFFGTDYRGSDDELAEILATQFEIANFEFVHYKTKPAEGWFFVEQVAVATKRPKISVRSALAEGKVVGEEVNKARVLANTPGGDMTPRKLAEEAIRIGKENGVKVRILGEKEIRALGMGGVLGVSKGSAEQPRFIVMEYLKGKQHEQPVVLVGKGVTFDAGGLNLKPESAIYEMHMDMSGGAGVMHVIAALARLKVKKNIVGLVPAVENMPSGSSYHPGDQLKTMSGKTIEVLNTDAEGRIILADALTYAQKYRPRLVIDVATLTGAAMAALGQRASALFTREAPLEKAFRELGERTGDFVWPLPLWEEFEEDIRGTFGDWANIGKTRYGGAITGAIFLWQFIKESGIPWVHIDIAPRMTAVDGEFLAKGSAGPAVALLVKFLRSQ